MAKVHGRSMEPTLHAGDRLFVSYAREARAGDLVLARFPDGALVVKRVADVRETRTGAPGVWLLSDDPHHGVDSRHRGVIADTDVLAVVLARVWPRPHVGLWKYSAS